MFQSWRFEIQTLTNRVSRLASIPFLLISLSALLAPGHGVAQSSKAAGKPASVPQLDATQAIEMAQQGRCREVLPSLRRAISGTAAPELRKKAGSVGLRCALDIDDRDMVVVFIQSLRKSFPKDPDIMFITVHAYSDLSSRTALDLGRLAPESVAAHKLNAESLEMQGKWDDAQKAYEEMIEKDPNTPGLHYLLGRLLLSKPKADAEAVDRAKQEFEKELELDPKNAGAMYVLGELARQREQWDDAIAHFSKAAELNHNFAEAYVGWGFCLITAKRYEEAVAPLRVAEKLTPGNPAVHYGLATALSRSGHKDEAAKEYAIHAELIKSAGPAPASGPPQ